ncbi:MAG TPA: glycosyl hydrolase family 18 protein [Longimicrobium sp.]
MIGRFATSLAFAALLLVPRSPLDAQRAGERLFYMVDTQESWESFRRNVSRIDVVAPDGYKVDGDGVVWGDVDPRVLRLAREHRVRVMPLLVNQGFDQAILHAWLSNPDARRRSIESLVELCRRNAFWGIQLDVENVPLSDRDAFTQLVREASTALHGAGFRISAAVVHRPDELAGATQYQKWLFANWRVGYDLPAIAPALDFVSVMTYAQHTRRTPPGPQAAVNWDDEVIRYVLRSVPAEKVSLGIPTGAQHWYTSQEDRITPELARSYSEQISHARAMSLIERYGARLEWDDEAQVPFAHYARAGTWEWIFMENARSFRAKLGLVERHRLRGISVWVLGPEDPEIWTVLAR